MELPNELPGYRENGMWALGQEVKVGLYALYGNEVLIFFDLTQLTQNFQVYWSFQAEFIDSVDVCTTEDHSLIVFYNCWDGDACKCTAKDEGYAFLIQDYYVMWFLCTQKHSRLVGHTPKWFSWIHTAIEGHIDHLNEGN